MLIVFANFLLVLGNCLLEIFRISTKLHSGRVHFLTFLSPKLRVESWRSFGSKIQLTLVWKVLFECKNTSDCHNPSLGNCIALLLLTGAGADNWESCFRDSTPAPSNWPSTSPVRGSTKNSLLDLVEVEEVHEWPPKNLWSLSTSCEFWIFREINLN